MWWVLVAVDDGCGGCCRVQRLSAEMLRPFVKFVLLEPTPSHPQAPLLRLQLQQLLLHVCRHSAAGDTWLSLLLDALPCYQVGGGVGGAARAAWEGRRSLCLCPCQSSWSQTWFIGRCSAMPSSPPPSPLRLPSPFLFIFSLIAGQVLVKTCDFD